ncbi:MAG: BMP family ABC transporter substrate-binding protein, partial [Anaerolineaceae bacterium]
MSKKLRLLMVMMLVVALAVAACGGDDDDTPDVVDTVAEEVEEAVEAVEEAAEEAAEEAEEVAEEVEEAVEEVVEEVEEVIDGDETEEPTEEAVEEVEEATEEVEEAEEAEEVAEETAPADFNVLLSAIEAAGLTDALAENGPFTIFAPSDEAFEAALEALGLTAEELLASDDLEGILLYHVVEGEVPSEVVVTLDGESVTTLSGADVVISVTDEGVMVNSANVIMVDVEADNGIIHVIDAVLLPPVEEVEEAVEEVEEAVEEVEEAEEVAEVAEEAEEVAGLITSACLVTDQGGIDDGNFNALANDGMERAAADFGLQTTVIESTVAADYAPNIQTCLESNADIVITVGFLLVDATLEAAIANPDTFFIGVDQFYDGHPENLVGTMFREDQAGFLVGAMAALMTETDIIAGVYGIDVPAVVKFRNGFEQGARYINPDITVLGQYTDSFVNAALGATVAEQFIGEGADVIFGAGGGTGTGGIQFAAAQGVLAIGVDQDEYFTNFDAGESPGAENLITSALKSVDVSVYDMIAALVGAEGYEWMGGDNYLLEAANNGIGFAPAHDADVPAEVTERIEEIFALLQSGELDTGVDG